MTDDAGKPRDSAPSIDTVDDLWLDDHDVRRAPSFTNEAKTKDSQLEKVQVKPESKRTATVKFSPVASPSKTGSLSVGASERSGGPVSAPVTRSPLPGKAPPPPKSGSRTLIGPPPPPKVAKGSAPQTSPLPPPVSSKARPPLPPSPSPISAQNKGPAPASVAPPPLLSKRPPPPPPPPSLRPPPLPKPSTLPPPKDLTPPPPPMVWATNPQDSAQQRIVREAEALRDARPEQAALSYCAASAIALWTANDPVAAEEMLKLAAASSATSRAVAMCRAWLSERSGKLDDAFVHFFEASNSVGTPSERSDLLGRLAALEVTKGHTDRAEKLLRDAVRLDPGDMCAWTALAALYASSKRWPETAEAWHVIASVEDDPLASAVFHSAVAALKETQLNDQRGARDAYEHALALDPTSLSAQSSLGPMFLRVSAWLEYAKLLIVQADGIKDPSLSRVLLERAGDVLWEACQDPAEASKCYLRASTACPSELSPLEKLASLQQQTGDRVQLARTIEQMIPLIASPLMRAAVLYRLGICWEHRGDTPKAIESYKRSLEAVPTFLPAVENLCSLLRNQGRLEESVALELVDIERIASASHRATRYLRIARTCEESLGRIDHAQHLYQRALELDPSQGSALIGLDRLLRQKADYEGLAALYEQALQRARDPSRLRALRLELASIYDGPLVKPDKALQLLQAALKGPQNDFPTLMSLARAQRACGDWLGLLPTLERQVALLKDPEDSVSVIMEIAAVLEERLGEPQRSLDAYQKVLAIAPSHEGAFRGLLRIHDGQSRWDDVVATERKLALIEARQDDSAVRLYRVGSILEAKLGKVDEAIDAFDQSISICNSYEPALIAREALLRSSGKFELLAESFEARASLLDNTPSENARILLAKARILELRLSDRNRALAAIKRVLVMTEANSAVLDALWTDLELHEVLGDWASCESSLATLLSSTSLPHARCRLLLRLARLTEFRLKSQEKAGALYDEALACDPGQRSLILDRLRSTQMEGSADRLLSTLENAAKATTSTNWSAALSRERLLLMLYGTERNTDAEAIIAASSSALEYSPTDPLAHDAFIMFMDRSSPLFVTMMRRRAACTTDTALRGIREYEAGLVAEATGNIPLAMQAYDASSRSLPGYIPALDGLRRLREAAQNWPALVQTCQQIADAAVDLSIRTSMLFEAADILLNRLQDSPAAVESYQKILRLKPDHEMAFAAVSRELEAASEYSQLSELIAAQIVAVNELPRKVRLLAQRAEIHAQYLNDLPGAIHDARKALELVADPGILAMLARYHSMSKQWQDALQAYHRLAELTEDPRVRRDAIIAQSDIQASELGEYATARELLELLIEKDGSWADPTAARRYVELCRHTGETLRARNVTYALCSQGSMEEQLDWLLLLAEIDERDLKNKVGARAVYEQAFAIASANPTVVGSLEKLFVAKEKYVEFVELIDEAMASPSSTLPGVLAMHMAASRICFDILHNQAKAEEYARTALALNPNFAEAYVMLGRVFSVNDDSKALQELRSAVTIDPLCVEAHRELLATTQRMRMTSSYPVLLSILDLLGELSEETSRLDPPSFSWTPMGGRLPEVELLGALFGPTQARFVRNVISILDPYLHTLFPIEPAYLASISRLPDSYPVVSAVHSIASVLYAEPVTFSRGAVSNVTILLTNPRTIVFGTNQVSSPSEFGRALFEATWTLALVASKGAALQALGRDRTLNLLVAATESNELTADQKELRKRIMSALPRRSRKDLERLVEEEQGDIRQNIGIWEIEEQCRGLRAGVCAVRDLRAVASSLVPNAMAATTKEERRRLLIAHPMMADAIRFAVSEACVNGQKMLFG